MTNEVRASERRKALLGKVRRRGGLTIYALAQALGRPYRRVFDAVQRLAAEGKLTLERDTGHNRRATLVFAASGDRVPAPALPAHLTGAERQALEALSSLYEAAFHMVQALLAAHGVSARTLGGVQVAFTLHFSSPARFPVGPQSCFPSCRRCASVAELQRKSPPRRGRRR